MQWFKAKIDNAVIISIGCNAGSTDELRSN